jgi:NADPH:quinone reductase-like Zn-dependent oxidoreductase
MKAIVQNDYGDLDVLKLRDVDQPIPADDEVLVRVRAASVHPDVWHVVRGQPRMVRLMGAGFLRPKVSVPGTDLAGVVETIGRNVTRFEPGHEVFGESVRGHQWHNGGAYAEYAAVPSAALARKPGNITFEQAAAVPTSALIAHKGLHDEGGIQAGQRVLINGAGGGLGTFAVQIATSYGATVTAVDSTNKLEMLRRIGAERVIDYTKDDFTRQGERYDLILDIPGNRSLSDVRNALTPKGTYVLIGHERFGSSGGRWIGNSMGRFFKMLVISPFVSQGMGLRTSTKTKDPLAVLTDLLAAGKITPVIDRTYPLSETREAMRYLEEGQAQGKIVLTM